MVQNGHSACCLGVGLFALTMMVTPTSNWFPTCSTRGLIRGKQWFCCNTSQFTDNVLLSLTPKATGSKLWESKGWQGSVAPFFGTPTDGQHGRILALCPCPRVLADSATVFTACPAGMLTETLFCQAEGSACYRQPSATGLCMWPSELSSPPCLPLLDASMLGSLRSASVRAGDPLLSYSWLTC